MTGLTVSSGEGSVAQSDIRALQQRQAAISALVLMIAGGVGAWSVLPTLRHNGAWFITYLALFATALAAYALRRWHRRFPVAVCLVLGPALSHGLALGLAHQPIASYFATLAVIIAAAVNPLLGFWAALANTVPPLVLRTSPTLLSAPVILLWLTAACQWLASRGFYTAAEWAENSQREASKLLQELRAHQGELNKTLIALTEATRRLQRVNHELAIARQQAEEARTLKEQFVANVSHELRTPLNLVVGFAEMMYLEPESYTGVVWTPELESDIGELYRASRHLQSLVNDVLDLSRIDATRLPMFRERQDVRAIIAEAAETIAPLLRQRGLFCHLEFPEELPELFVDRTRIRQVMLNLLNNAVRFTATGGITVRVTQQEEAVIVSVHDTGVGIPQEQLSGLFERFHQAEAGLRSGEGAGLGLALSRQFIELHGGKMWAESTVGIGSTFSFSLPLPGIAAEVGFLRRTPPRRRVGLDNSPVIVVDPDPTIAEMLSRYLGDRPVLSAKDGREAEELIAAEHPLAIIVNQLPNASTGSWLGPLGESTRRYGVPVIRCSIPSPSWLMQEIGLDDCLTKPVSREMLRRAIAAHGDPQRPLLIVDDNPGFVNLVVRMLAAEGWPGEVLTAYHGAEAVRLARQRTPALVLLDLMMPHIDGFAVLEEMRRQPSLQGTRIVAVTATSYAEEALRWHGGHLTITQAGGIPTDGLINVINTALQSFHPRYLDEEKAASSA